MKDIAIIIPAYNEEDNILKLVKKIKYLLPKSSIYIIDDSSSDNTRSIIIREKINYYHRKKKLGRGSAVLYGMKKAYISNKYDIFIEMDADLSHDPNELIKNINYFKKNKLDLLVASRYLKKSRIINWPVSRKIFSFLSNYLAGLLLKLPITDYTNGFRIYSKRAIKKTINNCGKIGDGFIILSEILLVLYISKYKINEVSSVFVNRVRGESSVNLKLIFSSFLGLLNLFFKKNKYHNIIK
jgi:dolichol-phosphate mannosyltransferase